jgi:hypothetical protein
MQRTGVSDFRRIAGTLWWIQPPGQHLDKPWRKATEVCLHRTLHRMYICRDLGSGYRQRSNNEGTLRKACVKS